MNQPQRPPLLVTLVATALGAGLLPGAPGTYGTLLAVPLAYGLMGLSPLALWLGAALVSGVGVWAADRYCELTGSHDNQQIVIDEVAGYLVTLLLVPRTPLNLLLAFLLFRLFDIWKPWPVRVVDRRVKGGFGVMADDLVAGVVSAIVLLLLQRAPWPSGWWHDVHG